MYHRSTRRTQGGVFNLIAFSLENGKIQAMKKIIVTLFSLVALFPGLTAAQDLIEETHFHRGTVIEAYNAKSTEIFGEERLAQELRVKLSDNRIVAIPAGQYQIVVEDQRLKPGDNVILASTAERNFRILEIDRTSSLYIIIAIFLALVIIVAGKRGISGIAGLLFTLIAIGGILIPQVIAGSDPLFTSLVVCLIATGLTIWISHGWNNRTHLAVASTFTTLILAFCLAWIAIWMTSLHGYGSENSYYLHIALPGVSLSGLLLGAILIGTVGILDDVTTTQCAAIDEISKANNKLGWKELFRRGMSVGKEHVAALINTLALAYVAAALPMFLLIALDTERPWWVVLNSEFFAEELIRTLLGSSALVLAVPIASLFAALFFGKKKA